MRSGSCNCGKVTNEGQFCTACYSPALFSEHAATPPLPPTDKPHRVFRHRGTPSDITVCDQIFTQQHYAIEKLVRGKELFEFYQKLAAGPRKPLIVDLGANIGASTVYFANQYPAAHVIAVEPEPGNFAVLESNIAGLDVEALNYAIGSTAHAVMLHDPGLGAFAFRTRAPTRAEITEGRATDAIAMWQLVQDAEDQQHEPFICKIDIEGAESDLFEDGGGWIDAFPLVIIELHDWLMPGARTSRNFLRCVAVRHRDFITMGENVFSVRNDR